MRLKIIYVLAGTILALVVVVLIITSIGIHTNVNRAPTNTTSAPIILTIKNIAPKVLGNRSLDVDISFNATNPNTSTAILEAIQYNMMVDDHRITSGTIGNRLEGFLSSSAGIYPIVGKGSVILKDNQIFQKNNSSAVIWNKIADRKARYIVTGTMSFREISNLQTSSTDKDFRLSYP